MEFRWLACYNKKIREIFMLKISGAPGEIRTRMTAKSEVLETTVSTNSTTGAHLFLNTEASTQPS